MHACTNCRRHVRENQCPFCGEQRVAEPESAAVSVLPGSDRLRRAALVASVMAVSACASAPMPPYGVPVDSATTDAAQDTPSDEPSDSMMVNDIAVYGIPPQDAGEDVNVMPPYGVPPDDAGTE